MNKYRRPLVIVADDDEDDQLLVKEAIGEVMPCEIISAYNGRQLIDMLRTMSLEKSNLPDFILLDLNMPMLDGFTTLSQLQKDEKMKTVPVYILSTSRLDHDKKRARELGARGFYTKPILYEHLKEIVEEIACRAQGNC